MLELLPPPPTINMEELKASCLLGKILGDLVPLHAIIHKTKYDWKFIKGQVEYIDMVNDLYYTFLMWKTRCWCMTIDLGM